MSSINLGLGSFTAGSGLAFSPATTLNVTVANSITIAGTGTGAVQLVNDSASPGNSRFYGTNAAGTRGWYAIASAEVSAITGTAGQVLANGNSGTAEVGVVTLTLAAALVSINSITSASSTDLTLTGNGGASLVLGNGANGAIALATAGSGVLTLGSSSGTGKARIVNSTAALTVSADATDRLEFRGTDSVIGARIRSLVSNDILAIDATGASSYITLRPNQTETARFTTTGVSIPLSTASTSTTTGALQVTGGAGIGGALFGTTANFSGLITASSGVTQADGQSFSSTGDVRINAAAGKVIYLQTNGVTKMYFDAAGIMDTGAAVGMNLRVNFTSALTLANSSLDASFKSTTEATTGGAGSLTTAGGIFATKAIVSTSAAASTSTTTGALIVTGGAGFGGALWSQSLNLSNSGSVLNVTISGGGSEVFQIAGASPDKIRTFAFSPSTNQQTSGTQVSFQFNAAYNQSTATSSNTDLLVNRTETAIGSGAQLLIDLQVATVSKFKVDRTGIVTLASTVASTSLTTGALVLAGAGGGLAVAGNIVSGGGLGWGVTSTATAAGTTTLTSASTAVQVFTGSAIQTVVLPAANVFGAGVAVHFVFKNRSSGVVTVTRAGSDTIDGNTFVLLNLNDSVSLLSDGVSAWEIV